MKRFTVMTLSVVAVVVFWSLPVYKVAVLNEPVGVLAPLFWLPGAMMVVAWVVNDNGTLYHQADRSC